MSINYSIINSHIPNVSGMVAYVPRGKRVTPEEMANSIVAKTAISKYIIQLVLNGLQDEVIAILCRGDNPDIGLGIFSLSLGGTFDSPLTVITPANADLRLSLTVAPQLREQVKAQVTFQKVPTTARVPSIEAVYDMNLAQVGVFTPGGVIRIVGDDLDFDETAVAEGVYFTSGESNFRVANYGRKGTKSIELVATKEAFLASQMKSISPTGIQVTVRSTYGTQTLRDSNYTQSIYRATFGGTVLLTDYAGVTGEGLVRAIKDDVGPGIKLAYEEHGKSAFGTAVAVSSTEEASYTLSGNELGNSLTVTVKGVAFYQFIEQSGIVNGESLNLPVDIF
jgi:hypothetical protein